MIIDNILYKDGLTRVIQKLYLYQYVIMGVNCPDHERERKKERKKERKNNNIIFWVVKHTFPDIFFMIVSVPFNFLFGI